MNGGEIVLIAALIFILGSVAIVAYQIIAARIRSEVQKAKERDARYRDWFMYKTDGMLVPSAEDLKLDRRD